MSPVAKVVLCVVVLVAFTIGLFVAIGLSARFGEVRHTVHAEFALTWITRAMGVFIAAVAALALLVESLEGKPAERIFRLVFPLLAGLLLIEKHWSLAVALGAMALGFVVKEIVALYVRRGPDAGPD